MNDESRIEKDPICGVEVDTLRARAVGIFGGVTYYFCSAECKGKFADPRKEPRVPVVLPESLAPRVEAPARPSAKLATVKPATVTTRVAPIADPAPPSAAEADDDERDPLDMVPQSKARLWVAAAAALAVIVIGLFLALGKSRGH